MVAVRIKEGYVMYAQNGAYKNSFTAGNGRFPRYGAVEQVCEEAESKSKGSDSEHVIFF